mmetsp:Transcript_27447/g.45017  ORF Transcript_27447/g.45017 Transcript_27447/m.45017 type:complete len:92 (-) Transcript_27447:973-1248(-)
MTNDTNEPSTIFPLTNPVTNVMTAIIWYLICPRYAFLYYSGEENSQHQPPPTAPSRLRWFLKKGYLRQRKKPPGPKNGEHQPPCTSPSNLC